MKEELLHMIWKYRLYDTVNLVTTEGEAVEVLFPGFMNENAGPDFLQARVRINDHVWNGSVEIHVRSSQWDQHGHQHDQAYRSVILHVVMYNDRSIYLTEPGDLPCLELKRIIPQDVFHRSRILLCSKDRFLCEKMIHTIPEIQIRSWIHRLAVERFERKATEILGLHHEYNGDWERTVWCVIGKVIMGRKNAEAFADLWLQVPFHLIRTYANDLRRLDALLQGQAGFLNRWNDAAMNQEYEYLKRKHGLIKPEGMQWKYFRMQTASFPHIRLAQFTQMYHRTSHLFRDVWNSRAGEWIPFIREKLDFLTNWMWQQLLMNGFMVLQLTWSSLYGNRELVSDHLAILEVTPPESNHLIRSWSACGPEPQSALESQGVIELVNLYCSRKKCLNCRIGILLIKKRDYENGSDKGLF